LTFEETDSCL
jgi:hypothetical protein